jgi:triphosphoribosyl-dephospho-CoA synthase
MEGTQTIERRSPGKRQYESFQSFAGTAFQIAEFAEKALLCELAAYPKPGMVSYVDSGSHKDMDASSFIKSAKAIKPFFAELAMQGFAGNKLDKLRQTGMKAEHAMFEATNGINTHKGAIFILGLLAAAAGKALRNGQNPFNAGQIAADTWGNKLRLPEEFKGATNGSVVYREFGIEGARGEAAYGFRSVYGIGLPALRKALNSTLPIEAHVHCFFALLETASDTTLIHRGGLDGLEFARRSAREFNLSGGVFNENWKNMAEIIHQEFIERNLSAGGVADLLAATIFINELEERL